MAAMALGAADATPRGSLAGGSSERSFGSRQQPSVADPEVTQYPLDAPLVDRTIPLARWVDPERLGAALLITSSCEDFEEKTEDDLAFPDPLYENPNLLVLGGHWRADSQATYREQALLGVDLMALALERIGVPTARIFHNDYTNGKATDPRSAVQNLIRRLPQHAPDMLVYYAGPSVDPGAWALGWNLSDVAGKTELITAVLEPEDLCPEPGPGDGPPGLRFVVADAPQTARMWMRPATRLVGVAAWEGDGMPGGVGGPALARWLAGHASQPPKGVVTFDLPPDVDMRKLPAYRPLFWDPPPDSTVSGRLLWELQEFVGAPTKFEVQKQACHEFLARGGPQLLLLLLHLHVRAEEALLLQIIWLLHHLVLHAPVSRWIGTMEEALEDVLSLPGGHTGGLKRTVTWNLDGRDPTPSLLAAVLGFVAATASRCSMCRDQCAGRHWPEIRDLVLLALNGERHAQAAVAASRAVAQVASTRVLDAKEHTELLETLVRVLLADFGSPKSTGEVRTAVSEALLFASLRCNETKKRVLASLGRSRRLPAILEGSVPAVAAKVLALVRSLAGVEPSSEVGEHVEPEVLDAVVHCLCSHATDLGVQRWGLAVLGALASAEDGLAERGTEPGATCIIWALGADSLCTSAGVEQEALFCAHALCSTATGRALLSSPEAHVIGLVAGAVAHSVHSGPAFAEACVWGLKFFERLARSKDTLPKVEPFVNVIIDAIRAEGCKANAAIAAAGVLSLLADGSPAAYDRIVPHARQIIKALTSIARKAAAADGHGEVGRRQEKDLNDWARVIVGILGEPEDRSAEIEAEEGLPDDFEGDFPGDASRRGSKDLRRGSKDGARGSAAAGDRRSSSKGAGAADRRGSSKNAARRSVAAAAADGARRQSSKRASVAAS